MDAKAFLAGGGALLLLAPLGGGLGFATLASPASGLTNCTPPITASIESPTKLRMLRVANADGQLVTLGEPQLRRAAAIVTTGQALKVPPRGQLIALMTALTESSLRVLANTRAYPQSATIPNDRDGSDHDSVGLFQQRPAAGWGAPANLMDPVWSSRAFYGGPDGPNHGSPRGLLDIEGWQTMTPAEAAQAVQVSAVPARYAVNQPVAAMVLSALTRASGLGCSTPSAVAPANLPVGFAGELIAAAASQLGKPYVWGGGNFEGPTGGGFDCSGLVLYAAYQASGGRLRLPHYTGAMIRLGQAVPWDSKQPGDLILFSYPGARRPHHVAIYIGLDKILQAPRTGDVVRYGTLGEFAGETMTVRRIG